jgi:hypothetical protein
MTALLPGELPLRFTVTPGGVIARCLCGRARTVPSAPALLAIVAHAKTCRPGADRANGLCPPLAGELPVRVTRTPVLACLCGAEATVIRDGVAQDFTLRLRSSGASMPRVFADLVPAAALDSLAGHTARCALAVAYTERLLATAGAP